MTFRQELRFDRNSPLYRNLDLFDDRIKRAIQATMQFHAPRIETAMKSGARWQDQTGLARQSLFARYVNTRDEHTIVVGGQAPYQIYLETRWNGKYAIVTPAIPRHSPEVMATMSRLFSRMQGGR